MSNILSDEELDNENNIPTSLEKFIKITNEHTDTANKALGEITKIKDKKEYNRKLRVLKNKYPFLNNHRIDKRTSNKKIFRMNFKYMIKDLDMTTEYLSEDNVNPNYISSSQLKKITKYIRNKLCGLFKHAQAGKTGLCIQEMINSLRKGNIIICFAKNTLDANDQWASRAISALQKAFPDKQLNEIIGVLATKCKNKEVRHLKHVADAETAIYKGEIQVLFVCSQSIRPSNIFYIMNSSFNKEYQKKFDIQYDECHNPKEGIPTHRILIENILMLKCVNTLLMCTATPDPLWIHLKEEDTDAWLNIWCKDIIMQNSFDYTKCDKIKSDSPEYSSLQNANIIKYGCKSDRGLLKIQEKGFIKRLLYCYENKYCDRSNCKQWSYKKEKTANGVEIKIKLKGKALFKNIVENLIEKSKLGMGGISWFNNEQPSFENGIDSLRNIIPTIIGYPAIDYRGPINKQERSIHIMSTPCRVLLTRSLQEIAVDLPYKPYVLGKYGGKNILMYKNTLGETFNEEVSEIMGEGEFNEQLNRLINYTKNDNRPLICMGNYEQTGESITYVHNKYGIVNSVHILSSLGAAWKDYQRACRLNYKLGGFDITDFQEKYLIGEEIVIENALRIEQEIDDHVDRLINDGYSNLTIMVTDPTIQINSIHENSLQQSIPVKITILEHDDTNIIRLKELFKKTKRTDSLPEIMDLLIKAYKSGTLEIDDKTGKLKEGWDKGENKFKINQNKCYGERCKNTKGYWKFTSYKDNYTMNHNNFMQEDKKKPNKKYDCDLLVCLIKYVSCDGSETNPSSRWWLVYKY
tara:strand:+ start:1333 stop:3747 length:2415 start_codon:yes stop_codon:yes gene_type:complete